MSERRRDGERHFRNRGRKPRDPNIPRVKAPPHLKGREIGLFYRDLQKNKQKKVPELHLPETLKNKITAMLNSLDNKNDDFADGDDYEPIPGPYRNTFKREYWDIVNVSFSEKLRDALQFHKEVPNIKNLNELLHNDYIDKLKNDKYNDMLRFRWKLPTYEKRSDILKAVNENQVVVISGETGCGKTTQVGQLILEEACANKKGAEVNIIITQPRRIAASSVAQRIAAERAENLGESVGYTIRLESKPPRNYGSIEVVTNGVLLQRLQNDPAMLKVSHIIIDEVHERDSICDITMGVVKMIISKRKDLKLILMSATLDAERFCQYFDSCPQMRIPGLMFPVKEFYLEDALQLTNFKNFSVGRSDDFHRYKSRNEVKRFEAEQKKLEFIRMIKPYIEDLKVNGKYSDRVLDMLREPESEELSPELVAAVIFALCKGPEGAILVFMPGYADIVKVIQAVQEFQMPAHILLPLHSKLNSLDQQAIFRRPPPHIRKIIVATNIAETSITIDDVVYVIDCGRMKMNDYQANRDMTTLKPQWISEANAHQRRGRAGRVQSGECWRLYTKARQQQFAARPAPELLRAPLHEPILSVLLLRLGPAPEFLQRLLDPPQAESITNAVKLLHRMRILDDESKLTPLGVHVARLPVAPGAARMLLLAALMSATAPATAIAATIAFRDPFIMPIGKEEQVEQRRLILSKGLGSDQIAAAEAQMLYENTFGSRDARDFCFRNFLSQRTLDMLKDMRMQFGSLLNHAQFLSTPDPDEADCNRNSTNYSLVKALIVAGLYPNIATYKGNKVLYTEDVRHVELHPSSVNARKKPPSPQLVYLLMQESTKVYLHGTSPAHALPLLFFGDSYVISPNPESHSTVFVESGCGKWMTSPSTAHLLGRLRGELDSLLQNKLQNPGPVDWDSSDGRLLMAIIELITAEDNPPNFKYVEDSI